MVVEGTRDADGTPGRPRAFVTAPGQGVNIARNTWHGVLTPLATPGLFAVVDRCEDVVDVIDGIVVEQV